MSFSIGTKVKETPFFSYQWAPNGVSTSRLGTWLRRWAGAHQGDSSDFLFRRDAPCILKQNGQFIETIQHSVRETELGRRRRKGCGGMRSFRQAEVHVSPEAVSGLRADALYI